LRISNIFLLKKTYPENENKITPLQGFHADFVPKKLSYPENNSNK
jgi:hypothetical protein